MRGLPRKGRAGWPTGSTRLAGVIGDPVRHSLSPALQNAAFAELGLDWAFVAFPVSPGELAQALAGIKALGVEGLSVTMPHKSEVARLVGRLSATAEALVAVNTVVRTHGELAGENTDGAGFLAALREEADFDARGRRCAVFGGGGAARAVVLALAEAGASEVVVVNRSAARARAAASLARGRGRVGDPGEVVEAELVVNATPVGMEGGPSGLVCDPELIDAGQLVVDLVYQPPVTPLIEAARARGATAHNGLGMLVHQAALAFALWTGEEAPVQVMQGVAAEALGIPRRS